MKRRHRGATWLFVAVLTMVAALVGATGAAAEGGGRNQFPSTSNMIRPGALLPDLVPDKGLLDDDHVIWRDPQTHQFLLAFSAGIENLGAGTMNAVGYRDPVARPLPNPNTMPAYQRAFHPDGSCDEVRIGTLTYHDIHHHGHLDGVMNYQLLDAPNGQQVKPNSRAAFCLADIAKAAPTFPGFPTAPAFNGCDPNAGTTYVNMGTSVGWEDIYDKQLFGQNFDVTDLMNQSQKQYFLQQTVDSAGIIAEQDDTNNTTGVSVTLGLGVRIRLADRDQGSRARSTRRSRSSTPATEREPRRANAAWPSDGRWFPRPRPAVAPHDAGVARRARRGSGRRDRATARAGPRARPRVAATVFVLESDANGRFDVHD
jgi:Lysyl oxidase